MKPCPGDGCLTWVPETQRVCRFCAKPRYRAARVERPQPGWTSLPRFRHLERHVRMRDRAIFVLLLGPLSNEEIAERMEIHVNTVAYRLKRIFERMPVARPGSAGLGRMALLRIAYGTDACWCE